MEAVQVGQRAVGLREAAQRGVERGPVGAGAAELRRDREREQATRADVLALLGGVAARAIAFDGRGRELARQRVGRAQRVVGRGVWSRHGDQNAGTMEPANFSDTKRLTSGDW